MPGALEGIKILEVNRVAPGSFLTMMLGDMGAEVIRVESPKTGAEVGREEDRRAQAATFLHRNKRSICLDLKDPAGQKILQDLAREADVLVEGFRPGVMRRLGGDYETLSALKGHRESVRFRRQRSPILALA